MAIKVQKTDRDNTQRPDSSAIRAIQTSWPADLKQQWPNGTPKHSIVTERCTTSLRAFLHDYSRWQELGLCQIDERKYTILEHVSQGLQKLHDMSVLHRDIKAENILLDGDSGECEQCHHSGTWKICDVRTGHSVRLPCCDSDVLIQFIN